MAREPEAITADAATNAARPAPRPGALAGTFLIDAHVHCHKGFEPAAFLDHAARNLARAARAAGLSPAAGWLLFTELADDHVFTALRDGPRTRAGWVLEQTAEAISLLARGPEDLPLVLVAGRQIATAEGLEVLALAAPGPFADGQDLAATVAAIRDAGGLAVLPWGFGKWWGGRGTALARFLEPAPDGVFLGDNGGRPALAPPPRLFARAAARRIWTLPGSDPLPLPAERAAVGRYGFLVEGSVDPAQPAAGLIDLLRRLEFQPPTVGHLSRAGPFLARQLALRRRRQGGVLPDHDVLTPDVETASEGYASRFAGPAGAWLLAVQRDLVLTLLADRQDEQLTVLELGGGHSQLTPALLGTGHRVVVHGSRPVCARQLRPLLARRAEHLVFVVADLWQLPFLDRTFDVVIGLRLLAHVERYESLLAEMARVSRHRVIVDFPPVLSANLLEPLLFRVKRRLEGNTRPFFCYHPQQLYPPLRAAGFGHLRIEKQFLLPMVVHRQVRRRRLLTLIEGAARRLGLIRLLGAPAVLVATRAPK